MMLATKPIIQRSAVSLDSDDALAQRSRYLLEYGLSLAAQLAGQRPLVALRLEGHLSVLRRSIHRAIKSGNRARLVNMLLVMDQRLEPAEFALKQLQQWQEER